MSKYVKADWLYNELGGTNMDIYTNEVKEYIDSAPAIDLVRCGECIHNGSFDTDCPFGWKNGEWNMPRPCDFCSYGEREKE